MRLLKNLSDWGLKRDKIDRPSEGLTHTLWETEDEAFGFYFYVIDEYGMMKNFCKLQILKDKTDPQIVYDSKDVLFIYDPYAKLFTDYDWTDRGLLVLRQLLDRGHKAPVVIIDLDKLSFISLDKYYVKLELNETTLTVIETIYNKADKSSRQVIEQIDLDKTTWTPLTKLTN